MKIYFIIYWKFWRHGAAVRCIATQLLYIRRIRLDQASWKKKKSIIKS